MTLSKQHYKAIAFILGTTGAPESTLRAFERYFAEDNPHFDCAKFEAAVSKAHYEQQAKTEYAAHHPVETVPPEP